MRKLAGIVFGALVGAGGVWFGYNYHVVRAEKEWLCVSKQRAALTEVYCDISRWGPSEWKDHPELAKNLVHRGRSDLVVDTAAGNFLDEMTRPFKRPPRTSSDDRGSTW